LFFTLKKLLLLTYFFPPANFAGSYRIASFAKYLHRFGWYPIVVTRQFKPGTASFRDLAEPVGDGVIHEQHEGYEVYRLPYKANWRDLLFHRYGDARFVSLRKLLSFAELVLQNFFWWVIPYANLYRFSLQLLRQDPGIKGLLASGNPYQLFFFCHLLHQKTGVPWVADYRDEWNSGKTTSGNFLEILESKKERQWLASATAVVSVTEKWSLRVGKFVNKPGYEVGNGFEHEMVNLTYLPLPNTLLVVCIGSLYANQPMAAFFKIVAEIQQENPTYHSFLQFHFYGASFDPEGYHLLQEALKPFQGQYHIHPKLPKNELLVSLQSADAFLMFGYTRQSGRHSAKVFDYLALQRPVLLYPDYPGVSELLQGANLGHICQDKTAVANTLQQWVSEKQATGSLQAKPDLPFIQQFSREAQAERLAKVLNIVIL
jgi:glycosyltransferase involved in cell wall biosynthesis